MRVAAAVLQVMMIAIGVALIARAIVAGGAVLAGVLVGVLFVAAGAARLWAERRP